MYVEYKHVVMLEPDAGGWSSEAGRVGDVAMVRGVYGSYGTWGWVGLGVRVAIPQVQHSHSADSGGEAESFGAEREVT